MTSAEEICEASLKDTKVKVIKGKSRKPHRGIKVSTPSSTGAGSVLRRTRSAKVSGKARGRAEESLVDNRGCKRNSTTLNPKINKVLSDIGSGSLMFSMGSSGNSVFVCFVINKVDANVCCNKNDGSFIKLPSEINTGLDRQSSPVAKSGGPKNSLDHTGIDDVGNTSGDLASSKGGIAIAKTGIVIDKEMTGSGTCNEHVGYGFEFNKNVNSDGILKRPLKPLFSVQFGKNSANNPFAKRFAEKLKQGTEELAPKMEYVPDSVRNIDGPIKGKDGKPMKAMRNVHFEVAHADSMQSDSSQSGHDGTKSNVWIKPPKDLQNAYTSSMCLNSWGRNSYARALVEVEAEKELVDSLVVAIPYANKEGHSLEMVEIEYKWRPPRCGVCKIFDHNEVDCPKQVKQDAPKMVDKEGFTQVTRKKKGLLLLQNWKSP
ncbi:hypothetical protein Tco_0759384 [Tanacetum coccineum]